MRQPNKFIIEGVDRMGKSTLIQGLLDTLGYHLVVHYAKPQKLKAYSELNDPAFRYQWELYNEMFKLLESRSKVIFDRGHLGELVYAPLYRNYDVDYIHNFEDCTDLSDTRLVLLTTSDWSFVEDDGLSIDFDKKEEEQDRFIRAFNQSVIEDKVKVNVSAGNGKRKPLEQILTEVLKK